MQQRLSLAAYVTLVFSISLGAVALVTLATVPSGCAVAAAARCLLLVSALGWLFLLVHDDDDV